MHPNTRPRILRALSERPGETAAKWLRRAECQIAFARAFASLLPAERTGGWPALIDEAQALLDGFATNSGLFGLSAAVQEAEKRMAPIGAAAKQYTVTCVGHGHIDMNWMWSWPETVAATHDTFASVLSLMRQFPDLTYSQSQASVYALVERYYPAMFEEIRERVKEGRWEVAAPHWVEGDKNLASGESLARHLLYARRYFAEKFGLSPEDVPVDWEPDTFGHANTVPGILAQGGVKFYYSCRTGGGFGHGVTGPNPRPKLFWWQGLDGSRVLVNRESTWYNSYVNIGDNVALPAVEFWRETGLTDWMNVFGIGNHGGGPTRAEVEYLTEMRDWPVYPKVVFGTAKGWFEGAEKALPDDLPVLDHELNFEFTGCYTSQSLIKQANRFGENFLEEAETLAALAARTGGAQVPKAQLREGWINILFNQFHDILPGSGVRQTREHATALFQETGAITGSVKRTAGIHLASKIDTLSLLPDTPEAAEERALYEAGGANTPFEAGAGIKAMESGYSAARGGGKRFRPYVVYNPCAWDRSEPVTVRLYDSGMDAGRIVARDETGVQHPTMLMGRGHDWGHDYLDVLFLARDVPALGYRTYLFCEGAVTATDTPLVSAGPSDMEFETPFLKLRLDRYQGGFSEVRDKRLGVGLLLDAPLGLWEYVVERSRGMTGWVLGGEAEVRPLSGTSFHAYGTHSNQGTAVRSGSHVAYRIDQTFDVPGTQSIVKLSALIHGLAPRIDVTAEIDWREIGDNKRGIPGLSVRFPLWSYGGSRPQGVRYETPFGSVTRDLYEGEEVPSLRYAHLHGSLPIGAGNEPPYREAGFTLLQDCKYGHSVTGDDLRLRIIRSSFDPDHAPEINKQTVRYSMVFHDAEAAPAELARLGAAWNHPLLVFPANLQPGDGQTPPARSFARVETEGVVLTALKQAEDGDALILRLAELNGADAEAVVTLDPALAAGATSATLVDLIERPIEGASAPSFDGTTLRVPVRANSFVTVRLG